MLTALTVISPQGVTRRLDSRAMITPEIGERVRVEANAWIKRLRLVRYEGVSMRERFTYRGDSLWWFTELYLHKMRRLEEALTTIYTLQAAVDEHAPSGIAIASGSPAAREAARQFARSRGLTFAVDTQPPAPRRIDAGALVGLSALASRLLPARLPPAGPARVAAFVHTAFWQTSRDARERETYIGDVIDQLAVRVAPDDLHIVGVGPRRTFRARRWWDPVVARRARRVNPIERYAPRRALRESLDLWRRRDALASAVTGGDEIRAAGWYGDIDLWPVLGAELADAARVQWTWSARAMDEARAALTRIAPDVAVTYAEAGGWGRALILEARRLGIATVGLQHGFIYRHWLNYQHEPDELLDTPATPGFPHPTCTLVFDDVARGALEGPGHLPPGSIAVTGSPRLDELAARLSAAGAERTAIRATLGVDAHDAMLVLAAKASEVAPYLAALFSAVASGRQVRLVVKPHPADTRGAYLGHVPPGAPITVLEPTADLGRLLAAADGLVTMNSTVALDALVLGVPALVVGLPNNLSPLVEAGVMVGASGDRIGAALTALLYDRQAREALLSRGRAFAETHRMRADGGSARRIADRVLSFGVRGSSPS